MNFEPFTAINKRELLSAPKVQSLEKCCFFAAQQQIQILPKAKWLFWPSELGNLERVPLTCKCNKQPTPAIFPSFIRIYFLRIAHLTNYWNEIITFISEVHLIFDKWIAMIYKVWSEVLRCEGVFYVGKFTHLSHFVCEVLLRVKKAIKLSCIKAVSFGCSICNFESRVQLYHEHGCKHVGNKFWHLGAPQVAYISSNMRARIKHKEKP